MKQRPGSGRRIKRLRITHITPGQWTHRHTSLIQQTSPCTNVCNPAVRSNTWLCVSGRCRRLFPVMVSVWVKCEACPWAPSYPPLLLLHKHGYRPTEETHLGLSFSLSSVTFCTTSFCGRDTVFKWDPKQAIIEFLPFYFLLGKFFVNFFCEIWGNSDQFCHLYAIFCVIFVCFDAFVGQFSCFFGAILWSILSRI